MLTVLHGESEFQRERQLAELRMSQDPEGLATVRFPRGTPISTIMAAARTPGFFLARRLVITECLVADHIRQQQLDPDLLHAVATLPPSCHIISLEPPLPPVVLDRLRATLGDTVTFLECSVPMGEKLIDWVTERARYYGVEIEPAAAEELLIAIDPTAFQRRREHAGSESDQQAGLDLARVDQELAKLATAVYPEKIIRVAVVRELVAADDAPLEWALIDALNRGDGTAIVRELERALETNAAPDVLLAQLANHFEALLAAQILPQLSPDAVAAATGFSARRIVQIRRILSTRSPMNAGAMLAALRTIDASVKRGILIDSEAALAVTLLTGAQRVRPVVRRSVR
ncbi:DNA polymerase III subunit delta [Thermomicrobium sp.]